MTNYQFPRSGRLEPRSPFKGGRITETDVLDLTEAAKFASVHAGAEITPADFLRAAGRGEITLRAIVHQTAKLERVGGGVYCNAGQPNENTVPAGAILNLPLSACSKLAATGRASWRTFDGFEPMHGVLMRYTIAELLPGEPDFETTIDDCRVTGNAVNALADAYIDEPAPATDTAPAQTAPAPVVAASDGPAPAKPNWRHLIQAEAREHWLRLRASGCNPSIYSICSDMARWCADNGIKGDKGQDPKAGTIRNTVLGGGHWTPPHHSVAEAKKYIAQIAQTKVAQTAQ